MSDLDRFVAAQAPVFADVLAELRLGRKTSHWMWFVFPQIAGLGRSPTARLFALTGLSEARKYLAHPLLGYRLRECTAAVAAWSDKRTLGDIFGTIDALKFVSSMTLFEAASGSPDDPFAKAIDALADGARDRHTLSLIAA